MFGHRLGAFTLITYSLLIIQEFMQMQSETGAASAAFIWTSRVILSLLCLQGYSSSVNAKLFQGNQKG